MSFATQSQMAVDPDFLNRCTSCAASEIYSVEPGSPTQPQSWVYQNAWFLATSPGFDAKYESAIAGGIGRPGWEPSVITDGDILSATQGLLESFPPAPRPTIPAAA
jgi:hypothetical protein